MRFSRIKRRARRVPYSPRAWQDALGILFLALLYWAILRLR